MARVGVLSPDKMARLSGTGSAGELVETYSRRARTEEALLAAFRDLFFERGYEAIRVGEVIYREYPNTRIAQEVHEKMDALRQRATEPATATPAPGSPAAAAV